MKFDFEVQHWPGRNNMVAYALYRLQSDRMDEIVIDKNIPECKIQHIEGPSSVDTINGIEGDTPPKSTSDGFIRDQHTDASCRTLVYEIDNNYSFYLTNDKRVLSRPLRTISAVRHVIQASIRQSVPYHAHDPKLAGHLGRRRMYDTMRRLIYWQHMTNDGYTYIETFVDNC